jgi:tetratricopeptide (TPR) repeat protein
MPLDLLALWDFSDPAQSEARFRAAAETADGVERQILQTQIARTYSLRSQNERAREILAEVADSGSQDAEVNARYHLELGRTLASAAHANPSSAERAAARAEYRRAFETADAAGLGYLAVDALHMFSIAAETPEQAVEANQAAITYLEASSDPEASKWAASLQHNLAYSLKEVGRFEEAIVAAERAIELRTQEANPKGARAARWMHAHILRLKGEPAKAKAEFLALQAEFQTLGETSPYVEEELALLQSLSID